MKNKLLVFAVSAVLSLGLSACGNTPASSNEGDTSVNNLQSEAVKPSEGTNESVPSPSTQNNWPQEQIKSYIGNGVPNFEGNYKDMTTYPNNYEVIVMMTKVSGEDQRAYEESLTNNSYEETRFGYKKVTDEGIITISVGAGFEEGDYTIWITMDSFSKGVYKNWPTDILNEKFSGVTIPEIDGAVSFDFDDYSDSYGSHVRVIAYGITEEEQKAYEKALNDAEFTQNEYSDNFKKTVDSTTYVIELYWEYCALKISIWTLTD